MENFRVALWVADLSCPLQNMEGWLALVRAKAKEAKTQGAHVLLMPEYACIHWLSFAHDVAPVDYLPWLEGQHHAAIEGIKAIAAQTGVAIIAGTFPAKPEGTGVPLCRQPSDVRKNADAPRYFNRAYIIDAAGQVIATQDKLAMTPWEMDEKSWNIEAGRSLNAFDIAGVRCTLLVCLDVEQPAFAAALARTGADVLLVPSMTMFPSGHARVFVCARARAIEVFMGVAVVGAVGEPPCLVGKETNYSSAAVYVPCERDLAETGVVIESTPSYGMAMEVGALVCADIPVAKIRQKRSGQSETWPGMIEI